MFWFKLFVDKYDMHKWCFNQYEQEIFNFSCSY